MKDFWNNRLFRVGAIIALVGWSPLLVIVLLGFIGVLSDPNPIGPGLLFFVSFWPAVVCLGIGVVQVLRARARG